MMLTALFALAGTVPAQQQQGWNGKRCAVVLTYDDALNVHLDTVAPLLDSVGLKGTFYLSGFFPGFRTRVNEWAAVGKEGHELGNHTLFHPCEGSAPGREWVDPDHALNHYSVRQIADEIAMANTLLEALDGKTVRTFAYPCGDKKAGDSSYVEKIRKDVAAARGVEGRMEQLATVDLFDVGSYMINGKSGEELIALVKKAMESRALIVFLFHGVGGEHALNVSADAHRQLVRFLKQNENEIWTAPMIDVAEFIRRQRNHPQH